jgi:CheY-like chemotaxis protein
VTDGKKTKIFFVDDDRLLGSIYAKNAQRYPVEFSVATGGQAAIDALRGGLHPDVILLDIQMPDVSGIDVLETMRKEALAQDARVVILSNTREDEHAEAFARLGISDFVSKTAMLPSQVFEHITGGFSGAAPSLAGV